MPCVAPSLSSHPNRLCSDASYATHHWASISLTISCSTTLVSSAPSIVRSNTVPPEGSALTEAEAHYLRQLTAQHLKRWAYHDELLNALRQVATRNTSMERINELDRQWLRELLLEEKPLIRRLQQTPPSRLMTNIARQHHLLLNKIFRTQRPLRPISRHQRWSPAIIGKLTKMTFDKPCAWPDPYRRYRVRWFDPELSEQGFCAYSRPTGWAVSRRAQPGHQYRDRVWRQPALNI